jgi:hypothetical protein
MLSNIVLRNNSDYDYGHLSNVLLYMLKYKKVCC